MSSFLLFHAFFHKTVIILGVLMNMYSGKKTAKAVMFPSCQLSLKQAGIRTLNLSLTFCNGTSSQDMS